MDTSATQGRANQEGPYCPSCGQHNPWSNRFCVLCGQRLPTLCPACGAANLVENRFCGACGNSLSEPISHAAPAPAFKGTSPVPQLTIRSEAKYRSTTHHRGAAR